MIEIQQTVDVTPEHEIFLKLPDAVPVGRITITISVAENPAPVHELRLVSAETLKSLTVNKLHSKKNHELNTLLNYKEAQIAIAALSGESHEHKSFIKYAGCLKNSSLFKGDSAVIQKKMRDEWN
ncbi:MAG: hypothetical protein Pg6A_03510 [Termitinemataceae bacterium]|nr:MAG: hypothetical protein Pg6A_03510 [Termitinemataceae bacterium]